MTNARGGGGRRRRTRPRGGGGATFCARGVRPGAHGTRVRGQDRAGARGDRGREGNRARLRLRRGRPEEREPGLRARACRARRCVGARLQCWGLPDGRRDGALARGLRALLAEPNMLRGIPCGAREVVPRMVEQGRVGTIVFTGATAALRGKREVLGAGGRKVRSAGAGRRSMARELGPQGVHVVHVVIDGQIETRRAGARWRPRARSRDDARAGRHRRGVLAAARAAPVDVDSGAGSAPVEREVLESGGSPRDRAPGPPRACHREARGTDATRPATSPMLSPTKSVPAQRQATSATPTPTRAPLEAHAESRSDRVRGKVAATTMPSWQRPRRRTPGASEQLMPSGIAPGLQQGRSTGRAAARALSQARRQASGSAPRHTSPPRQPITSHAASTWERARGASCADAPLRARRADRRGPSRGRPAWRPGGASRARSRGAARAQELDGEVSGS